MENESKNKLILAVLQGEDYDDTVYELNRNGFFATLLSSTGGFLKKRSVTLMIGVSADKADQVLAIALPTLMAGEKENTPKAEPEAMLPPERGSAASRLRQ